MISTRFHLAGSGGGEAEPEGEKDGTVNIEDLVNSIKTSVPYSKSWVDSSGDIIDEDYLGVGDINSDIRASDC